jgi:hypothetical protein
MPTVDKLETAGIKARKMRAFDPYLYRAEMPLTAVYYPLGFPLELSTNSGDVLEAAEESWGSFTQQFSTPAFQLKVGVLDGAATECPATPTFRAQRNLIVGAAGHDNFWVSDVVQGFSFAWLTRAVVSHRSYLRYHFLEATALSHIANRHTAPIHAACVELDGRGVLLCGESGAGKSSLSFACARAGWTYITDDASYLLNGRSDRQVVGNCNLVRLRPSATVLFAGMADEPLTQREGGKPSIELVTSAVPGIKRSVLSSVDHIVFLNRRDANIQELTRVSKNEARRYMHQNLHGMEELRMSQIASVESLLNAEMHEIRYRDLNSAVDRLTRLVRGQD